MKRRLAFALLPCLLAAPAVSQDEEETPVYIGRAFVFEADLEWGVELGWLDAGYDADEVMAEIERSIDGRLLRTGRFVEGKPRAEPNNTLSVTFVGKQAQALEDMLVGGIAAAGRFTLHALPTDEDFASCGSSRERESSRLEAWRAASPAGRISAFNHVAVSEGGPCETIQWLARWPSDVEELGAAVAVRRQPELLVRASDSESFELVKPSDETAGLEVTLTDEALTALRAFGEAAAGREVAIAIDSQVTGTWLTPGTFDNPLVIYGRFDIEVLRHVVMSFAAEPLPAPLRYVEVSTRELPNVKIRDSPTAIE